MKKTLLITNGHQDYTGGGTYVMMMLNILKHHYDIYTTDNIEYYVHPMTPLRLERAEIKRHNRNTYDVHLFANFWGWMPPMGKINAQIMYYPVPKKMTGWNRLLLLCDFCKAEAERLNPELEKYIITPYYNPNDFYIGKKSNTIINVGHYFLQEDGHSKNQHLVLEWFKNQNYFTKLVLHGKMTHPHYYQYLVNAAQNDPRVHIYHDCTQEQIRKDLSEAKYLIHANGYSRKEPVQQEHYGLVILEAMLSGCQPIVHNSGGAKDIPGVTTYNTFNDITFPEVDPQEVRKNGFVFSKDNTEIQLLNALKE